MKKTEMKEQAMFSKKYECVNAKVCGDVCDHSHPHEHNASKGCPNSKICYKLAIKFGGDPREIHVWRLQRAQDDAIEAGKCKRPECVEVAE